MSTVSSTAGEIFDAVRALLNDIAGDVYSNTTQLPYLKIAAAELREHFALNNVPVTNQTTTPPLDIDAGVEEISFTTTPALPSNLVEIQQLWQRPVESNPWIPVDKREYLPHNLEGVVTNQIPYWVWEDQKIKFLPSNADLQLKLDYIKTLFTDLVDEDSVIGVINADTFLSYRTAALVAEFIGENKSRADDLNGDASLAIDRTTGISTKGRQSIVTRRRPFRQAYKNYGYSG